jgi:hypothetical protein
LVKDITYVFQCQRRLVTRRSTSVGFQERLDGAGTVSQRVAQVPPAAIAGLNDVAQGNGLSRSFGANRPAEKAVVMKDADFGHVAWIIGNDDGVARVGSQVVR